MATKNNIPSQLHDSVKQNFRFTTAHGTSLQTLHTVSSGQDSETYIRSILVNNLEASTREVHFYINDGTDDVFIGSSGTIAALVSPTNGKKEVVNGLLTPLLERVHVDVMGNPYLRLLPSDILKAKLNTAVTTNNNVFISMTGSKFLRSA